MLLATAANTQIGVTTLIDDEGISGNGFANISVATETNLDLTSVAVSDVAIHAAHCLACGAP